MSERNPDQPNASVREPSLWRSMALRWRWYHFYFLLALFDVVVIMGSLLLYHRTVAAYQVALSELRNLEDRQRWAAGLRLALVALNAPGNDVFESREVAEERARFEQMRMRLQLLLRRDVEFGIDLSGFRRHLEQMIGEEQSIFEAFDAIARDGLGDEKAQQQHASASASMAAMDRSQAAALGSLFDLEQRLLREESQLLDGYGAALERRAATEKYLFGTVILILLGVFWYGRKLQHTHERMLAEQQRFSAERHERLAAVGEVCAAVAHGIRNPLSAMISSAQLALEFGTLDEATRLRLKDVLSEGQRLDRRVTRLLDFARAPQRAFERYPLKRVVAQAIHEIEPKLEQHGIQVTTQLDGGGLWVYGDPERFAQSIIELLSNAMDCQPGGGRVQVICRRDPFSPERAALSVIDDGPGIPEAIRARVFELFFTSKAEGNGIGLASVRRTVEMHGGQVSVVPTDGRGAHIQIVLPLA
jgi:signal transduction histidine kinase